jgi:hypothetical protein
MRTILSDLLHAGFDSSLDLKDTTDNRGAETSALIKGYGRLDLIMQGEILSL